MSFIRRALRWLFCVHEWKLAVTLPQASGENAAVWRCEHCNRHIIVKSEG